MNETVTITLAEYAKLVSAATKLDIIKYLASGTSAYNMEDCKAFVKTVTAMTTEGKDNG